MDHTHETIAADLRQMRPGYSEEQIAALVLRVRETVGDYEAVLANYSLNDDDTVKYLGRDTPARLLLLLVGGGGLLLLLIGLAIWMAAITKPGP